MRSILTAIAVVLVLAVAFVAASEYARDADTVLSKLELQQEARTCWEAKETLRLDMPRRVTDYCDDIIERYSAMVKAYDKEQLQQLLKRAQEK